MLWIERMFLAVLRMALPGSLCILAVLAARLLLRRMPARFCWALWGVAAFRLVCPVALSAPFGLLPAANSLAAAARALGQGLAGGDAAGGGRAPALGLTPDALPLPGGAVGIFGAGGVSASAGSLPGADGASGMGWQALAAVIWLAAALGLFCWQLALLLRLGRRLRGAQPGPDGAVRLPGLSSAFVFGLVRPRICLPAGLGAEEERMILAHERAHLRRGDHLTRPLAWALVCVYWFDPLVWLGYCLAMRDMERCCDEAALRGLGPDARQGYARALLALAAGRPAAPWAPAFGQEDVKGRIRRLLRPAHPARWALALAGLGVAAVCAALAFAPARTAAPRPEDLAGRVYQYEKEGFYGDFTLRLEPDGQFWYYEGAASSYIGHGSWTLEGRRLTLRDDAGPDLLNQFEVEGEALVFVEEGSTNFLYLKLADGERFLPLPEGAGGQDLAGLPGDAGQGEGGGSPEAEGDAGPDAANSAPAGPDGEPLTFWINPDEPPEVLGDVAAKTYLAQFTRPEAPDTERLAEYTLRECRTVSGTPPEGQSWEEMPYQYLVQITYDITTASEGYLAPGDGIAGLGSFAGLYRELAVKALERGGYAIVSAGTGGGQQAFAADPALEEAVHNTLLSLYADPPSPDAPLCESHVTLYWEEVGSDPHAVRMYLMAMVKGSFGETGGPGGRMQPAEWCGPVRLTLIKADGQNYTPMEVWPLDALDALEGGEAWQRQLEEMFPPEAIDALQNGSRSPRQLRDALRAACDAMLAGA